MEDAKLFRHFCSAYCVDRPGDENPSDYLILLSTPASGLKAIQDRTRHQFGERVVEGELTSFLRKDKSLEDMEHLVFCGSCTIPSAYYPIATATRLLNHYQGYAKNSTEPKEYATFRVCQRNMQEMLIDFRFFSEITDNPQTQNQEELLKTRQL